MRLAALSLDDEAPALLSPGSFEAVLEKINEPSGPDPIVEAAVAPVLATPQDMKIPSLFGTILGGLERGLMETHWWRCSSI